MKLKVGDLIKLKDSESCVRFGSGVMEEVLDHKPRKIISFKKRSDGDCTMQLDGVGSDVFVWEKAQFEKVATEMLAKEKEMKFKINDWIIGGKGSFFSDKPRKIYDIVNDNLVFGILQGCINKDHAILVCGFTKNQIIEVSNDEYFKRSKKRIFNQYREELNIPFECVSRLFETEFKSGGKFDVKTWAYAREIKRFECYEPEDLQREWIGEKIYKAKTVYKIVGLNDENLVISSVDNEYLTVPFSYLYNEDYLWSKTEKIFGKEVR